MHEYTLIRSKRKSIALHIMPDATVEVRAHLKASNASIDKFVASKENWINKRFQLIREQSDKKALFSLNYGDTVLVCGKGYPIAAKPVNRVSFDDERFYMPPDISAVQIKYACVQIYNLIAKQTLTNKTTEFAKQMGVAPIAMKINSAKTRWGSCSAQKSINY